SPIAQRRRTTMTSIARALGIAAAALMAATAAHAADISPELIAKAKQEGQLTYYTDLIVDQIVRPLTAAFEAKYGIKVSFARADSQVNIIKLMNEHKANRVASDVFGLTSGLQVLIDAGVVRQFTTANGDDLPPQTRHPPMTRSRRTGRTRSSGSRTTFPAARASSATCSPSWARCAAWSICAS